MKLEGQYSHSFDYHLKKDGFALVCFLSLNDASYIIPYEIF